jgi:hypothetical protein
MFIHTGYLGIGYLHATKKDSKINPIWLSAYVVTSLCSKSAFSYLTIRPPVNLRYGVLASYLGLFGSYALAYGAGYSVGKTIE